MVDLCVIFTEDQYHECARKREEAGDWRAKTFAFGECADRLDQHGQTRGHFCGTTDFILRLRKGMLIPSDTGDQGGGQN